MMNLERQALVMEERRQDLLRAAETRRHIRRSARGSLDARVLIRLGARLVATGAHLKTHYTADPWTSERQAAGHRHWSRTGTTG